MPFSFPHFARLFVKKAQILAHILQKLEKCGNRNLHIDFHFFLKTQSVCYLVTLSFEMTGPLQWTTGPKRTAVALETILRVHFIYVLLMPRDFPVRGCLFTMAVVLIAICQLIITVHAMYGYIYTDLFLVGYAREVVSLCTCSFKA